ncbi:MAG TPA: hypothetical protein VNE39_16520 [Planctomycetota bacterium]|nr:hypothetical protein [Planctomycetota bacterium]
MRYDRPSHTKPSHLDVWGDSLLGKLPARTRKKRKREASKKRRVILREEDNAGEPE